MCSRWLPEPGWPVSSLRPASRLAWLSLNYSPFVKTIDDSFVAAAETGLTRTLTICAMACILLVGGAVASILGRDSVPSAQFDASNSVAVDRGPVSNTQGKKDKLPVAGALLASLEPAPADSAQNEPLRQAFASESSGAAATPGIADPGMIPSQPAKPKLAAKPPVQKTYALLSDAQIAAIKGRLNLTASQQQSWPAVEDALRAVARRIHDTKKARPGAGSPPIDPESAEVQQLKSAAMLLLFSLREDQKREVRALARIIGLEAVASAI